MIPTPDQLITFGIRLANALLWTVFVLQILREDRSLIRFARQMVLPVILCGMWLLVAGSLATMRIITGEAASLLYTLFTAGAALIALVLVTNHSTE